MKLINEIENTLEVKRLAPKKKTAVWKIASDIEKFIKSLRYNLSGSENEMAISYLETAMEKGYSSGLSSFRGEALINGLSDKQMKELWLSLESKFKKQRIKVSSSEDEEV